MLEKKYKILFVCLGNICRSPAAEGIMKDLIKRSKLEYLIEVDSAGTYGGHAGDLPDSRMRAHALRRGYNLTHRSRQIRVDDFDEYDMIIAMDDMNVNKLRRLAPDVASIQKIYLMTDYCTRLQVDHVPDHIILEVMVLSKFSIY